MTSLRSGIKGAVLPKLLDTLNPHWSQLAYLRRLLRRLRIDCVLDVGANVGQFAHQLRSIGYLGLILSFEPDPDVFPRLENAARSDGLWHAFSVALGAAVGTMDLNIMKSSDFNSFRRPTTRETDLFAERNAVARSQSVEVDTLGNLLPALEERFGFSRTFLKMDTQGFDHEVFAGSSKVAGRLLALQSEVSVLQLYEGVPDWRRMIEIYEEAGFELANLFSVSPGFDRLIEFDCYMVQAAASD